MPTSHNPRRNLVSLNEAAEYAGCSTRTIRRIIASGGMPAYRLPGASRMIRVDLAELEAALSPVQSGVLAHA